MSKIRNVPHNERSTHAAFMDARKGTAAKGQLAIGQGVTYRNHNWTVSGYDTCDRTDSTTLRLINTDYSKEALLVERKEVNPLIEIKPEEPLNAPTRPDVPMGRGIAGPQD